MGLEQPERKEKKPDQIQTRPMSPSGGALPETSRELAAELETKRLEQGAKVAINLNGYNDADTAIGRLIRDADAAHKRDHAFSWPCASAF